MTASNPPSAPSLADELAAALDWWRDAGVDNDFTDDATAWLQSNVAELPDGPKEAASSKKDGLEDGGQSIPVQPATSATPRSDFFAEEKPKTLTAFHDFWMSAPGLDAIGPRGRIAPRGAEGADLMVLVVEPEADDRETLLSGPQGRLLDSFLKAAGIDPANTYLASALTRNTPMADTHSLAQRGLDAVLLHHIALAQPKRLIGFGAGLVPLLGLVAPSTDNPSQNINHTPPIKNALLSEGLDALLDIPRLKARFWRRWIEWSALH
ncbi:MAG: hypothetical protein AAFQ13_08595 [Pseudomonadota bacterium]